MAGDPAGGWDGPRDPGPIGDDSSGERTKDLGPGSTMAMPSRRIPRERSRRNGILGRVAARRSSLRLEALEPRLLLTTPAPGATAPGLPVTAWVSTMGQGMSPAASVPVAVTVSMSPGGPPPAASVSPDGPSPAAPAPIAVSPGRPSSAPPVPVAVTVSVSPGVPSPAAPVPVAVTVSVSPGVPSPAAPVSPDGPSSAAPVPVAVTVSVSPGVPSPDVALDLPPGVQSLPDISEAQIVGVVPPGDAIEMYRATLMPDAVGLEINLAWGSVPRSDSNPTPVSGQVWLTDTSGRVLLDQPVSTDTRLSVTGVDPFAGQSIYVGVSARVTQTGETALAPSVFHLQVTRLSSLTSSTPAAKAGGVADSGTSGVPRESIDLPLGMTVSSLTHPWLEGIDNSSGPVSLTPAPSHPLSNPDGGGGGGHGSHTGQGQGPQSSSHPEAGLVSTVGMSPAGTTTVPTSLPLPLPIAAPPPAVGILADNGPVPESRRRESVVVDLPLLDLPPGPTYANGIPDLVRSGIPVPARAVRPGRAPEPSSGEAPGDEPVDGAVAPASAPEPAPVARGLLPLEGDETRLTVLPTLVVLPPVTPVSGGAAVPRGPDVMGTRPVPPPTALPPTGAETWSTASLPRMRAGCRITILAGLSLSSAMIVKVLYPDLVPVVQDCADRGRRTRN